MELTPELKKIMRESTFQVIEGTFVYAKVSKVPDGRHFMITQDKDEITVVTEENKLSELDAIEKNKDERRLIALHVPVPFYSVGFLATISGAIAEAGMNVLIVSTYSKDYIMVKKDLLPKAKQILLSLDFRESV